MIYPQGEVKRLPRERSWKALFQENGKPRPPVPDHLHGTLNAYTNYGCRCVKCKAAGSEGNKKNKTKRVALARAGLIPVPHGTRAGYINYQCRCVKCKLVNRYANAPGARRRRVGGPQRVMGHRPLVGGPWLLFLAVLHDTMRGRRFIKS